MIKGVFLAIGIMVLLALIPIVDLIGIPFGPFIGGYYGISSARAQGGSYAVKSVVFRRPVGTAGIVGPGSSGDWPNTHYRFEPAVYVASLDGGGSFRSVCS